MESNLGTAGMTGATTDDAAPRTLSAKQRKKAQWKRILASRRQEAANAGYISNTWIITDRPFLRHPSLESAQAELDRLLALTGNSDLRILRVKNTLETSDSARKITKLVAVLGELLAAYDERAESAEARNIPACQKARAAIAANARALAPNPDPDIP